MHSKISRVITIKVISPPNQQRRDKELGTTIAKQNNLINQKEERRGKHIGKVDK